VKKIATPRALAAKRSGLGRDAGRLGKGDQAGFQFRVARALGVGIIFGVSLCIGSIF
jgi:hypothetical protein